MLRVKNPNARILVYAPIIFVSLSVTFFLVTCEGADTLSVRLCGGLHPVWALITISIMTLGGTMVALAYTERNLYVMIGFASIGLSLILVGFGFVIGASLD